LVWAVCFLSGCRLPESPTGLSFTILTYNVHLIEPAPDAAVGAVSETDADVVCLQEATPGFEALCRRELAERYRHMRFRHAEYGGGLAVLAKLPVSERAHVRPKTKGSWFPGWVLLADTPVGKVQILVVHLRAPISDGGKASLSALARTALIRVREIEELYGLLDEELPTIILGDFNEGDAGQAIKWLKARGFTDALGEFDWFSHTWRWKVGLEVVRRRFDHILYSRHLHCLQARVLRKGRSDHLPVVGVFEAQAATPEQSPQR
jgi:endonuclease/exonuclease/phosphatase family metal-dependent hydrolase